MKDLTAKDPYLSSLNSFLLDAHYSKSQDFQVVNISSVLVKVVHTSRSTTILRINNDWKVN